MPDYLSRKIGDEVFCGCAPLDCHSQIGDFLDVVISGVSACGCQSFSSGPARWFIANYTINGTWNDLEWNGSEWTKIIGTLTYLAYDGEDCSGEVINTIEEDLFLRVICTSGEGEEPDFILTSRSTILYDGINSIICIPFTSTGALDATLSNFTGCGISEDTPDNYSAQVGTGGNGTVSLP